jgi:hypothetical protein
MAFIRYPKVPPVSSVSCPELSRLNDERFTQLYEEWQKNTFTIGETFVFQVVDWVRENIGKYLEKSSTVMTSPKPEKGTFGREWYYFHHLFSRMKRSLINKWTSDFNLTGFMAVCFLPCFLLVLNHFTYSQE